MDMNEIQSLLAEAYETCGDKRTTPEVLAELLAFELLHHMTLPEPYRTLLLQFGALSFAEPVIYGLKELKWAYPQGMALIAEYRRQDAGMLDSKLFPIGGFGDGDLLVLMENGAVFRLYHDGYAESPLERISPDLPSLLFELADLALEIERTIEGK